MNRTLCTALVPIGAWVVAGVLLPRSIGLLSEAFAVRSACAQSTTGPSAPYYDQNSYRASRFAAPAAGPVPPTSSTRPSSWPGGAPEPPPRTADSRSAGAHSSVGPYSSSSSQQAASGNTLGYEGTQIFARVGSEVILASEILYEVEQYMRLQVERIKEQTGTAPPPEEVEKYRPALIQQKLEQWIDIKLVVIEARRTIPAEGLAKYEKAINEHFDKDNLPRLIKQKKVNTRTELDARLRQEGSSLDWQRRAFFEQAMQSHFLHEQIKENEEISVEDMLKYYREHIADWESPAQAQWEHLAAHFSKFGSKEEARRAIEQWGDQVLVGGMRFSEVAKAHSQDSSAENGGLHDWTTKDSLVSAVLDQAVFGLPVGRLSQILEDERGYHIVRVVQRKDAARKSFPEAQPEIKKKLRHGKDDEQLKAYLAKLRAKTPVWTIFDEPRTVGAESKPTGAM